VDQKWLKLKIQDVKFQVVVNIEKDVLENHVKPKKWNVVQKENVLKQKLNYLINVQKQN